MNKITPHEQKSLNLLRWLAIGVGGIYLYKAYKQEGSLLGATGNISKINIDTNKLVDSAMPWIKIPEHQKEIVAEGLKKFADSLKKEIIKKD
jgi:hypothetical protein